jgi:hypothetical protein
MPDELDDLVRRAAATLDRQTPAGYFDTLPDRALARLDDDRDELARARALRGEAGAPPGDAPSTPPGTEAAPAPAARGRARRTRAIAAAIGLAVALAAGLVIFVSVRDSGAPDEARAVARTAEPAARPVAIAPSVDAAVPSTAGTPGDGARDADKLPAVAPDKPTAGPTSSTGSKRPPPRVFKPIKGKVSKVAPPEPAAPGIIEPFDEREFGKIRTGLSRGDVERTMDAVAAQARACFAAPGAATLQLTVSPTGRVASVTVSGGIAGTPVATCIERAVTSATFPPWRGTPQRFGYRLLSE